MNNSTKKHRHQRLERDAIFQRRKKRIEMTHLPLWKSFSSYLFNTTPHFPWHFHSTLLPLLAAALFAFTPANAVQEQEFLVDQQLLPLNYPSISETIIVESFPRDFLKEQQQQPPGKWKSDRWHSLLWRMQNPEAFEQAAAAFEKHGFGNGGNDVTQGQIKAVENFIHAYFPRKFQKTWYQNGVQEFQRARDFRAFVDRYRDDFLTYSIKMPVRIGSIAKVELGQYDKANKRFPIKYKNGSPFRSSNSRDFFTYRSTQSIQRIKSIPVPPSAAESLIARLNKWRTVYVVETHLLTGIERHPTRPCGVTALLDKPVTSIFVPGDYKKPLHVKEFKPLSQLTLAEVKTTTQPSKRNGAKAQQAPNALASDTALTKKMSEISSMLNLFNIKGIPITGRIPSGILDSTGAESFMTANQVLADRIFLHTHPEVLQPNHQLQGFNEKAFFVRVLGQSVMSGYLDGRMRDWRGGNEFDKRKSKARFYSEQSARAAQLAMRPPFRFRTLNTASVGAYNFDQHFFPLQWNSPQSNNILSLSFPDAVQHRYLRNLSMVEPLFFPKRWKLPTFDAETMTACLPTDGRYRKVYVSTTYDVSDATLARPAVIDQKDRSSTGPLYLITPRKNAIYLDKYCQQQVWDMPIIRPPLSLLETRRPTSIPTGELLYLSQREVQVALAARDVPESIGRNDWVVGAIGVHKKDSEFYHFGTMLPHRIRGLNRSNLLWQLRRGVERNEQEMTWDKTYQPFFPINFFGKRDRNVELFGKRLRDEQLDYLKTWMSERLANAVPQLRIDCGIDVNYKYKTVRLARGESNSRGPSVSLGSSENYGATAALTFPRNSSHRFDFQSISENHYSMVFPAIQSHLNFEVDWSAIPEAKNNQTKHRFTGDLVVELEKTESIKLEKGYHILFHIRPVKFEALEELRQKMTPETPIESVSKVAFSIPVDIKKLTLAEYKRQTEEQKKTRGRTAAKN